MPYIYTATDTGILVFDANAGAKTGRWCKAPQVPDRSYACWDPETLKMEIATGYVETTDDDGEVWRHGTCPRCEKERGQK